MALELLFTKLEKDYQALAQDHAGKKRDRQTSCADNQF